MAARQKDRIASAEEVEAFFGEVARFCERNKMTVKTFSRKALRQTYAVENLRKRMDRARDQIAEARAFMSDFDRGEASAK
ncbi:MAG: hypothetical protein F9K30_19975 [Dechloromonas sp.]|nr:MAG: hypothetical protein F9K30_19975 [Dechloromonas sp.]